MKHLIFIASVLWGLSGCASSVVVPDVADSIKLEKDYGILATNINTSWTNHTVTIINKNALTGSLILKVIVGDNFRVISLPAGEYTWRGMDLGNLYSEFRDKMDFTIRAQEINYIGDLVLDIDVISKKYRMGLRDGSDAAEQRLKNLYPNLSKTYKFSKSLTVDKRQ